jgi:Leucine-rich repeat (LRR) protein
VRSLDLSEALKDMPQIVSSLNSFTALEQLNISHNGLETFPDELVLPHLKTLDISFNDIQDLTFLKSFHSLEVDSRIRRIY